MPTYTYRKQVTYQRAAELVTQNYHCFDHNERERGQCLANYWNNIREEPNNNEPYEATPSFFGLPMVLLGEAKAPALSLGDSQTIDAFRHGRDIGERDGESLKLSESIVERVVLYSNTNDRVRAYVVLKPTFQNGSFSYTWNAAAKNFTRALPVGELLAERDEVKLHRCANDATMLRWVVGMRISPPFAPDSLLPCCTGAGTDITSWYWNPRKEKLYKLNNIAAPHASRMARVPIDGAEDTIAQLVMRYSAPHNRVIHEVVLVGAGVPDSHAELPESERRRILSLSGESIALTTARFCGLATRAGEFVFNGRLFAASADPAAPALSVAVRVDTVSADTMGTIPDSDHLALRVGGSLYEGIPLGYEGRERPKPAHFRAVGVGPLGSSGLITVRIDSAWYGVVELRGGKLSTGHYMGYTGDSIIVFACPSNEVAARSALCGYNDPRTGNVVDITGDIANAVVHYPHSRTTFSFEGEEYIWSTRLGDTPGERIRESRNRGRMIFVPESGRHMHIATCDCCDEQFTGPCTIDAVIVEATARRNVRVLCGACEAAFPKCHHCGMHFPAGSTHWANPGICTTCHAQHFIDCSSCGTSVARVDVDRTGVCRDCRNARSRLRDYSFRPVIKFHNSGEDDKLHFGAEIELETENDPAERAWNVLQYPGCKNFLIAKRDGSLNNGAEFVTQPFTWKWFKENKQRFVDIFGLMAKASFRRANSCGLHIHASRGAQTPGQEFRLMQLVYENPKQWLQMSLRPEQNRYCQLKSGSTAPRERLRVARERSSFHDRYVALNPTHFQTLEWRLWAGVDTFEAFAGSLALTAAAHAFVKSGGPGGTSVRPKFDKFKSFVINHDEFGPLAKARLEGLR